MSRQLLGRTAELATIAEFLTSTAIGPSGLAIEGEAGIGKTTLWSAAAEQACERGYWVLAAQADQAESTMGYTAVADMLSDVPPSVVLGLPTVQRAAVDRVLWRSCGEGPETDERAIASAFLAILETLAAGAPVILAIDNLHWLDAFSNSVVTFAARQLKERVGVLVTQRPEPDHLTANTWLSVGATIDVSRIRLGPLTLSGLNALIADRLGRSLSHATMLGIAEISQGNPFYALELARAVRQSSAPERDLPRTLTDLVRSRISDLDDEVHDVLLAAACATSPTVELLGRVIGTTPTETAELLGTAESKGIVGIDGDRVQFSHPLLARGVYIDARPSRRRTMHRTLARVEVLPEVKARHLALATTTEDPATIEALDVAADSARARGAPAAAAEFVDLAIRLGGDTPLRRIRSARYHFHAGNYGYARALLEPGIRELPLGPLRASGLGLLAEMYMCHDSFAQAAELLDRALENAKGAPARLVHTLMVSSFARIGTGEYDRSLRDARAAVTLIDELSPPALRSQAKAVWVIVNFVSGYGVDVASLQCALDLEVCDADIPVSFRASTVNALVHAWTGRLDEASARVSAVRRRCTERAEYGHLMFIDLHSALIEVWRGDFTEAAQIAEAAIERAEQLGGDHAFVIADSIAALVAAYAAREDDARTHAGAAIERADRCGSPRLADQATIGLGFLEVSLGNYADALTTLEPMVARFMALPCTEIVTAAFLPDAIEAMIALGRLDDAEPMIGMLEHHGRRLDRAWMLAVAARCRSMMLAAQGDLAAATRMVRQAITAHQGLPMPFERARTDLLLGQLQRRQRRKGAASTTLSEAMTAFERMKVPLWADRARRELARVQVSANRSRLLTPSEHRVAELAASGLTNREIAATVFIATKTVEVQLARVYRKLGVHSRAELSREFGEERESGGKLTRVSQR